ncbi:16S rRNA (guanine(966)-N(2))-methyltransferase RsmD [Oxalobacter paraformigenes]|uniref:RsmD family RNA methyltransferase n=1 Tax=Oxalobacter paraformigenes TaxID=556268 RepID=C3X6P0_9BURK|nr:16S rRNA (guanine(966)-N(2))-methyltransferase RsmD [Oxalobacter paraformigenes]EEO28876.1 RsmD family RNA methyltransferase [Oxalobacter paraformigenes]
MIRDKNERKLSSAGSASHKIRITGGLWKRTPLAVPDVAGLRPTPDRVRETLFNWLTHLRGSAFGQMSCLDLFAGTGALGFEAASRGISKVTMVEEDKKACSRLQLVKEKLGAGQITVLPADAVKIAGEFARAGKRFDLIFLDPPFQKDFLSLVLPQCINLLTKSGLIYIEADKKVTPETLRLWVPGDVLNLQIIRAGKAGQVCYHLLEMKA